MTRIPWIPVAGDLRSFALSRLISTYSNWGRGGGGGGGRLLCVKCAWEMNASLEQQVVSCCAVGVPWTRRSLCVTPPSRHVSRHRNLRGGRDTCGTRDLPRAAASATGVTLMRDSTFFLLLFLVLPLFTWLVWFSRNRRGCDPRLGMRSWTLRKGLNKGTSGLDRRGWESHGRLDRDGCLQD